MLSHIRNLVFEGGGVKGIAYVGALERLEEEKILQNIIRVGGTSAGAINAVLLALDYSGEEVREILWEMDFRKFMDGARNPVVGVWRLFREFGWFKGDYFKNWIRKKIAEKTGNPDTTFRQLKAMKEAKGFRDLYIVGTNLSTSYSEVFSHEEGHHPDMAIAEAVRISMSIPLFFRSVKPESGDCYVDGGLLRNYPVRLFDRKAYVDTHFEIREHHEKANGLRKAEDPRGDLVYNQETLGFRLDKKEEIEVFCRGEAPVHHPVPNLIAYLGRLVNAIMEDQQNRHLASDDWHRTIYIDTGKIETTQFDLSNQDKNGLVTNGRIGVMEYLDWYEKDETARNRPRQTVTT